MSNRPIDRVMQQIPPSYRDREVLRQHVEKVLVDSKGTLVPSWEGHIVLKGTIPTMHAGVQYHTPVCFRLADYPHTAPVAAVVPQETMLPYTKAKGYNIQQDGLVHVTYQRNWGPGSTLSQLVSEMQRLFQKEPPLYEVPPGYRQQHGMAHVRPPYGTIDPQITQRVKRTLETEVFPKTVYQDRSRVEGDIAEAIAKYPTLVLKGVHTRDSQVPVAALEGTVPTRYKNNVYNIPCAIIVPPLFPQPRKGGIPEPLVTPTPDMKIKPNHRHVDQRGVVYCDYLSQWANHSVLHQAIATMIHLFEADPPVYAVPRNATAQQPVAVPNNQARPSQASQPTPAADPKAALKAKLTGDLKTTELGDQDEDKACIICLDNVKDCVCLPCKHMCLCAVCVREIVNTDAKCPMCRNTVDDVILNLYC